MKSFQQLPGYQNIACLSELDMQTSAEINSAIWAPKWTERCTRETIEEVQHGGGKVFVWTVDLGEQLSLYLSEKKYDGILTNVPALLAFYFYTQQPSRPRS